LPPSPSAVNYSPRAFTPSPSTLNAVAPTEVSNVRNVPTPANASTTSLGLAHTNSPPLSDPPQPYSYDTPSSLNFGASNGSLGPAIRPLDFGALMLSREGTHTELARTVADLSQWLSVVEVGLSGMLDTAGEDTIAEEQEEPAGAEVRTELLVL